MPENPGKPIKTRPEVISAGSPDAVARIADALLRGEIVSFPTDTVYALAASLDHEDALSRLYLVKGRPESKPIPILLGTTAAIDQVASKTDPAIMRFAERFWPGALTVVVPARPALPAEVTGASPSGTPTVAVRVPDDPFARAIINRAGGAIAATSANRSGSPPGLTADAVLEQLGDRVGLILDGGRAPGGVASTVVALGPGGPIVLRCGGITVDELVAAWASARRGTG